MSIELVTKYLPYVDEVLKQESKTSLITNTDFNFDGAKTVVVYKISTAELNDYTRNITSDDEFTSLSRYGTLYDLDATTESFIMSNDKSFIFNVDRLDEDETDGALTGASALSRELREVIIPTLDSYTYGVMADNAGTVVEETLTADNIYTSILSASEVLDDAEVPDTERCLIVTPATYSLLKQAVQFDSTDVGNELRLTGVVGILDGMNVIKVPASRMPSDINFMVCHPIATVAPIKLEDYSIHTDTIVSSGTVVTGRVVYDAYVLENKKQAIYVSNIEAQG